MKIAKEKCRKNAEKGAYRGDAFSRVSAFFFFDASSRSKRAILPDIRTASRGIPHGIEALAAAGCPLPRKGKSEIEFVSTGGSLPA